MLVLRWPISAIRYFFFRFAEIVSRYNEIVSRYNDLLTRYNAITIHYHDGPNQAISQSTELPIIE